MLVDLIVPARDCERSLPTVIRELPGRVVRSVVVVDNGSRDATARVAEDAGALVLREPRQGLGAACLRAVAHLTTLPAPPDAVVFMAPDGTHDPADLPALVKPLDANLFDLVVGSRALGGARHAAPTVAVNLIHAIYGHRYSDLHSLCAIRYPALIALGLSDLGAGFFAEMQVKAVRVGLRIAEAPVHERPPLHERSLGDTMRERLDKGGRTLYAILRHATAR